jgi:two-component system chemotaxis sensor kinase CheA
MQDQDVICEFLVESHENLSRLDRELVELEKHPADAALLASIFRTIHTIKGTCGFLGFSTLEKISHQAESLLSQLREGERELTPSLVSLVLETVDATRRVLASIEASGAEGPDQFDNLTERLRNEAKMPAAKVPADDETRSDSRALPEVTMPKVTMPEVTMPEAGNRSARIEPPVAEEDVKPVRTERTRAEDDPAKPSAAVDSNIRVGVGLLDNLMDLVGELVLTRNQILQFNAEREDPALNATAQRLNLITSELQEGVMKTRMQPIGMVWNKLPRVVRDMAVALGKQVRLEMDGAETELDRTIIEAIKDPLVHLVRNSCDHGIEAPDVRVRAGKSPQGRLSLRAYHEGGQVNIEIADDGAGIDVKRVRQKAIEKGFIRPEQAEKLSERETLNLIFHAGFSTAEVVTNVSGRGVGMDVVKSHIEKIGGIVDVFSRQGEGSTVKIKIPLTLAIIPGLVISSGGERFVIPQVSLLELIRLEGDSAGQHTEEKRIEHVHGTPVYRRRGSLLPVAYLNKVLGLKSMESGEALSMVVLQAEDRQYGLVVDGINDTQEIVVKPLGKQLKGISIYAGATIMGDGRVALILDVLGIGQRSGVIADSHDTPRATDVQKSQSEDERQRLLLFRAGSFDRLAVPLSLVARLEEFRPSVIEHAAGGKVVQYRDRVLPLVSLRSLLEPGLPDIDPPPDVVQVVVFNDGDRNLGVIVDQIVDVAEEEVAVRQKSGRAGLLGSAVVGKRVTDFLDLNYVIQSAAGKWTRGTSGASNGRRILLAEASAFSRGLIRGHLDMAGYRVQEAASVEEAIRSLERQQVDVVVAALDLAPDGTSALVTAMRKHAEWSAIPVLALVDSFGQTSVPAIRAAGFEDCQARCDRAAMIESLERLASALAPSDSTLAVPSMPVCAGGEA